MKSVRQMKKFKFFLNIIKEEQWLNEQLQKGYLCTNISGIGIYTFEQTSKEYVMRLDYQEYLSKEKQEEYLDLYKDFGWSCIKCTRFGGIQYWQTESNGQNEIFSDHQSKRNYYKRLMGYSVMWGILFLLIHYMNFNDSDFSGLYHRGLWDMTGSLFWKAFVFETPFVLLKLAVLMMAITMFYNAYRQYLMLKEK